MSRFRKNRHRRNGRRKSKFRSQKVMISRGGIRL